MVTWHKCCSLRPLHAHTAHHLQRLLSSSSLLHSSPTTTAPFSPYPSSTPPPVPPYAPPLPPLPVRYICC
ncbi:unnamed protein product [Closterium sp. NIES-54]